MVTFSYLRSLIAQQDVPDKLLSQKMNQGQIVTILPWRAFRKKEVLSPFLLVSTGDVPSPLWASESLLSEMR